jgi:hypothetical protein
MIKLKDIKMKKIGLVLVLLFGLMFISCGEAVSVKTDLENYNVKGRVKQINEMVRNMPDAERFAVADSTEGEKYDITRVYKFNEGGYVTEMLSTNQNSTTQQKCLYDKDGVLTMIEMYQDDKLVRTLIHRYSAVGQLTSVTSISAGEEKIEVATFFEYDKDGNVLKEINKDADGNKMSEMIYTYDAKGRKTSSKNIQSGGYSDDIETLYRYNDAGDISQIETKDNFLKESTYQDFRYYDSDKEGNWTRRETIFMQGRLQETKREYEYYE